MMRDGKTPAWWDGLNDTGLALAAVDLLTIPQERIVCFWTLVDCRSLKLVENKTADQGALLMYFPVLCRQAHHHLRCQPMHTFYAKLAGSDRESDESSGNQRGQVHFIYSGRLCGPVHLTQRSVSLDTVILSLLMWTISQAYSCKEPVLKR